MKSSGYVFGKFLLVLLAVLQGRAGYASTPELPADSLMAEPPGRVEDAGNNENVKSNETFRPAELILPVSLIAVGTYGAYGDWFKNDINRPVKESMDRMRGTRKVCVDDYLQYLPVAAYLGLGFTGIGSSHTFRERVAAGATTYLVMSAIVNAGKYAVREPRPDSGKRNSFPSGHTATAFAGAELLRAEYGTWVGLGAYTVAAGVAFLRLYNGRHWLNDVVAGAGVGILSARIGYMMLPVYRRWFGWETKQTGAVAIVAPSYDPTFRAVSFNFVKSF